MTDEADIKHAIFKAKGFAGENLADLPSHAILDRGRVIGFWEFDTASNSIAWMSFIPRNKDLAKAVEEMEQFVRNDLGDARSFSLDSPKSRAPKIESIREAGM
jgi:hypothetical protein